MLRGDISYIGDHNLPFFLDHGKYVFKKKEILVTTDI